jgi:hypothetical protein
MHYCTFVIIGPKGDPDALVAGALAPFDEALAVPPYREYLQPFDIERMASHYTLDQRDLEALAQRMNEWTGRPGGVDERGLYFTTTNNPEGRWDWYEIGGRWNGLLKRASRNVISTRALRKSPDLKDLLPYYVLTPDGTWLEYERARLLIDGMPSNPFSLQTLPPRSEAFDPERAEIIRRVMRRRFAQATRRWCSDSYPGALRHRVCMASRPYSMEIRTPPFQPPAQPAPPSSSAPPASATPAWQTGWNRNSVRPSCNSQPFLSPRTYRELMIRKSLYCPSFQPRPILAFVTKQAPILAIDAGSESARIQPLELFISSF